MNMADYVLDTISSTAYEEGRNEGRNEGRPILLSSTALLGALRMALSKAALASDIRL